MEDYGLEPDERRKTVEARLAGLAPTCQDQWINVQVDRPRRDIDRNKRLLPKLLQTLSPPAAPSVTERVSKGGERTRKKRSLSPKLLSIYTQLDKRNEIDVKAKKSFVIRSLLISHTGGPSQKSFIMSARKIVPSFTGPESVARTVATWQTYLRSKLGATGKVKNIY